MEFAICYNFGMERLKPPEDNPSAFPGFYCSSIEDMLSSREEIIDQMIGWHRSRPRTIQKLIYAATNNKNRLLTAIKRGEHRAAYALIDIAGIRHYPSDDKEGKLPKNKIIIRDATHILVVDLPKPGFLGQPGHLDLINEDRRRLGHAPISYADLRRGWVADVTIDVTYSPFGKDVFEIVGFNSIEVRKPVPERQRGLQSLSPVPQVAS